MRILQGLEEREARNYIQKAAAVAKKATCLRSKCGSIIVRDKKVIAEGFNSPPHELENQRRCLKSKDEYDKKVTDKTCCVHTEQRAIMNALKTSPSLIQNSKIYFIRLDKENKIQKAGEPYCTICSKMALDSGISKFILYTKKGLCEYDTEDYNSLSFSFRQ